MSATVISLDTIRQIKQMEQEDLAYKSLLLSMSKPELLEEMVRFQEERIRVGHLTFPMMIRGKHLFSLLEQTAESRELQNLTRAYRRHLEFELQAYLNAAKG